MNTHRGSAALGQRRSRQADLRGPGTVGRDCYHGVGPSSRREFLHERLMRELQAAHPSVDTGRCDTGQEHLLEALAVLVDLKSATFADEVPCSHPGVEEEYGTLYATIIRAESNHAPRAVQLCIQLARSQASAAV